MTATTHAGSGWAPDQVSTFDPDDLLADGLIVAAATKAGEVDGDAPRVTVPYVHADPDANVVAEAAQIELSEGTFDQIEIATHKIAVVSRVSAELTSQPGAADRIAQSLRRSVISTADAVFLTNSADPAGLLNVPEVPTAGTIGADAFAVFDAIAKIEADGGQASNLLVNPLDWALLSKIPEATGSNKSALSDLHAASQRSLAGVPVTVHSAVSQGTALMVDRSEVVAAYGPLRLARSEDAFFSQDAVGIRATWRIGWSVVRPNRLQRLTVDAATA